MNDEYVGPLSFKIANIVSIFVMQALFVSLAWSLLFQLNQFIFADISVNKLVCWIFMPAFIRMLAVMIFDWAGVFGLVFGAYITRDLSIANTLTPFMLALISGVGPYVSMRFCQKSFHLPESFDGLRPQQLIIFAFAGSVVNTGLNHFYYQFSGIAYSLEKTFIPMMVGDFVGTLLMLYFAALIIRTLRYYFQTKSDLTD
jgi:hypothetical protein